MNSNRKRFTFAADEAATATNPVGVLEAADGQDRRTITGYAVVWGAKSWPSLFDGSRYRFAKGSIEWTPEVFALWHHQYARPLGSTANGSLRLTEDDTGVRVEIDLDDTTDGRDLFQNVKSRLVRGMSFGGLMDGCKLSADDPNTYDVVHFVADEVTATIVPSMTETQLQIKTEYTRKQQEVFRAQRRELDRLKLALLQPGRVSAQRGR